ncbi:MAG: glycosyltransferase [Acidobacteria bacterium]|nr:glycosyltransferase [Acidobacteriota bacterium]MBI3425577.1 glycosyltransferase [Acidobacteriota bacterium]
MTVIRRLNETPIFSVCIPQYNRTSFLIEACKSLDVQTFREFEVCISDGGSTDGRENELLNYLKVSQLSFAYQRHENNLRYDTNLRASIALAQGQYCILHGNDDALAGLETLQQLFDCIKKYGSPGAMITNFEDWRTGTVTRRVRMTGVAGTGPRVAAAHFRNVSFVGGVLLDRAEAQKLVTDKWDGSEMYQMYLMARIVATGKPLLLTELSTVRKDIQIPGESVDSYAKRARLSPCPIETRVLPLAYIGPLISDAIAPALTRNTRNSVLEKVFQQLYCFTYPFWLVEYRRVQSWKYALGVCLGIKATHDLHAIGFSLTYRVWLKLLFWATSLMALLVPVSLFESCRERLFSLAKSFAR